MTSEAAKRGTVVGAQPAAARNALTTLAVHPRLPQENFSALLAAIIDTSPDALLVLSDGGDVLAANRATGELLRRNPADILGYAFGSPIDTGQHVELDVIHEDNHQVVEAQMRKLELGSMDVYVASLRDVTERKQAAEALSDFVRMTAHEIRTPMTSMLTAAASLSQSWKDMPDAERQADVDIVLKHTRRLAAIADTLLTLSKIDARAVHAELHHVAVDDVLHASLRSIAQAEDITVTVADGLTMFADPEHVDAVIRNLLQNAFKYGAAPVTIEAIREGDQALIRVHDEGDGVPASFGPELFDRFTRAPQHAREHEGTGLGLALCRSLMRLGGGEVSYDSASSHGATFVVSLPIAPPHANQAPADTSSSISTDAGIEPRRNAAA